MIHTDKLAEIFVKCDDFCKDYEQFLDKYASVDPIKKTLFTKK